MSQARAKSILPADRARIALRLKAEAHAGRFNALRNRALVLLAAHSGLRLGECLALTVSQVLENPKAVRAWRLRTTAYIRVDQAKGRTVGASWTSAGPFQLTKPARRALQLYLQSAQKHGAIVFPVSEQQQLFVQRSTGRALRARTIQYQFQGLLQRAGVLEHYRFHDLRHDAMTRFARACGGDVFQVASFGRCDPYTAQRYVHADPAALAALADRAAASMT